MTREDVARELISILSTQYGIGSDQLLGALRDRASVNNVAMATLKVVYLTILDVGCFSHTIDNMGRHFNTPTLRDFLTAWLNFSLAVLKHALHGGHGQVEPWEATVEQGGGRNGR